MLLLNANILLLASKDIRVSFKMLNDYKTDCCYEITLILFFLLREGEAIFENSLSGEFIVRSAVFSDPSNGKL